MAQVYRISKLMKRPSTWVNQTGAKVPLLLFYTGFGDSILRYSNDDIALFAPCFDIPMCLDSLF